MTIGVGTIGAGSSAVQATVVSGHASTGASPSSFSAAVSAALPVHNPVVIQDPVVGFITEYLSANGSQVVSQTPSAITVAYLRTGLTADGERKTTQASSA